MLERTRRFICRQSNFLLPAVAALPLMAMLAANPPGAQAQSKPFEFGILGDTDYSFVMEKQLPKMMAEMNKAGLSFVVHIGDFEADPRPYNRSPTKISMPCVEKNFKRVLAVFQTSKHPFVLTPGDNDWTDCSKLKAQKVNPLDALSLIRGMFYPKGKSLGQNPMPVVSQSGDAGFAKFVENLTWSTGNVTFATVHLVGSNNNMGKKPEPKPEFTERTKANTAWVKKAFAKARADNALGLVLITQANPAFEGAWKGRTLGRYFRPIAALGIKSPKKPKPRRYGYDEFHQVLLAELATFKKPTLLMHGDNHYVRIDQPLYDPKRKGFVANFTRVETFGSPTTGWIHVKVDPEDPDLFTFKPRRYRAK
ncbi:MAG: hypothetical protein HOH80_11090 [Rhodospirillaceae bacterium]|nr:hypothetical protein [Rhodospirillaceae bacterium]MBT7233539.1 hypothetical protein [Rhodospirillaceae bacterium]